MKNKKAFTLAETMIVLVILGIVASITIPALVRNQMEVQNRTRIKKAMTVYDTAINKMVVENNLKSNDALYSSNPNDNRAFAPQDNCTRSSAYFKILRTLDDDNGTNCRFCSSDNVCWDISNILKPIIGIGEEGITDENSTNRYRMFAHFGDNGELRVDDVAYEQSHNYLTDDEKGELVALYNFANNVNLNKNNEDSGIKIIGFNHCEDVGGYIGCNISELKLDNEIIKNIEIYGSYCNEETSFCNTIAIFDENASYIEFTYDEENKNYSNPEIFGHCYLCKGVIPKLLEDKYDYSCPDYSKEYGLPNGSCCHCEKL